MASENNTLVVSKFSLCDKDHFRIVKGISILAMLAAYLCNLLFGFVWYSHIVGVAGTVFLLCSGYGLSESFINKRGLVHYWENKMMKVWVPSLVVMIVVSLIVQRNALAWIEESPLGLKGNFLYMLFGAYAAFWALFQFMDNKAARVSSLFVIAVIAFFLIDSKLLATQILAFPLGTMFSQLGLKYKVRRFTWKGQLLLTLLLAAVAAGAWMAALRFGTVAYLGTLLLSVAFIAIAALLIFGVFFAQKLQVFGFFAPIGTISFGLYLLYDDVFALIKGKKDVQTALVALLLLIAAASLFTWLRFLLITWNKNLRRRKKTHLKGSMW